MSLATNKNGEIVFNKEGKGIRDILSVVRRGMRMNDSQRRFALTASTVLVLLVVANMIAKALDEDTLI